MTFNVKVAGLGSVRRKCHNTPAIWIGISGDDMVNQYTIPCIKTTIGTKLRSEVVFLIDPSPPIVAFFCRLLYLTNFKM